MRKMALLLSLVVLGSACSNSADMIEVTARFRDVGDLVTNAPVTMADIKVGHVTDIRLDGEEAVVTLALDAEAQVPEGVTARVRRTSVLGERIVDIVLPDTLSSSTPSLENGARIEDTVVRSDLEDLVDEGVEVLGAISASQLAVMIEEGARGFGGQGQNLGNLLTNYRDIVHAYAGKSEELSDLIGSLRRFNETIAAEADAHARSVVNTARSIEVLKEESGRLERAVISLNRLAVGSRRILNAHLDEMKRFFSQTRTILGVLEEEQRTLARFLKWAPGHNYNTQAVEWTEFNQVVQDFVICGLNDDPDNPARRCTGGD
jgi:phospholipid/cholesterol/gamma-HCH transport system substrate-binding protein